MNELRRYVRKVLSEALAPENLNDNFWSWFAGSKVADSHGNPIPVHHGTSKKFSKFSFKNALQRIIWFTSNKSSIEAGEVGAAGKGHIMDLYASIKNPAGWDEYEKYGLGQLQSLGYDGAILPDPDGSFTGFVFKSSQLKSVKNKGEWSSSNDSIFKEEISEAKGTNEDEKSYQFYLLCDKLCQIESVEVKNKMVADAVPVSKREFVKNCGHADSLFKYEGYMLDDPSHGFYKSNVKGHLCYYMQYVGFEFIFMEGYPIGKAYWLEEDLSEVSEFPKNFDFSKHNFNHGDCDIYAVSLHRLYGYPLYIVRGWFLEPEWGGEREYDFEDSHVVVKLPNGNYMDSDGETTEAELRQNCAFGNDIEKITFEPVSEEEALSTFSCEDQELAIKQVVNYIKSKK